MADLQKPLLSVNPTDKIRFIGDLTTEVPSTLRITNKSDTKQAYKVKCTRNDIFRIRPALGILDYNQTTTVCIYFKAKGLVDEDKLHFGVYHIPAPEGCTSESAWAEHYGPPQGELRLRVAFEEKK